MWLFIMLGIHGLGNWYDIVVEDILSYWNGISVHMDIRRKIVLICNSNTLR